MQMTIYGFLVFISTHVCICNFIYLIYLSNINFFWNSRFSFLHVIPLPSLPKPDIIYIHSKNMENNF